MQDKRKIDISVTPVILLIITLFFFLVAAVVFLNFPAQVTYAYVFAVLGAISGITAYIKRPTVYKEVFGSKKTFFWVNDIILIFSIIGTGVLLSFISFKRNIRYDFTRNQIYSLSDQTISLVRGLENEVRVSAFYANGSPYYKMIEELLKEYARHNRLFKYTMIDPHRDPVTTKALNVREPGTVVIQASTCRVDVSGEDIFQEPSQMGSLASADEKTKFRGEQLITSAVISVTSGERRKIVFVSGHGEGSLYSYRPSGFAQVSETLAHENYDISEVILATENIPRDTTLLCIISPEKDYMKEEIIKIRSFLKRDDTHLLVALDPSSELDNLEDFLLKDFGVLASKDIVVDPRGIAKDNWTVSPELEFHPITEPIIERQIICMMFHCRSLIVEARDGFEVSEYLKTTPDSWAKRSLRPNEEMTIRFEEGKDARGPLTLGVTLEEKKVTSPSRIIILGDSDFFSNNLLGLIGNKDLFLNSVNWTIGKEAMLTIRPRILEIPLVVLEEDDAQLVMAICVVGFPVLILLLGAVVFIIRRSV